MARAKPLTRENAHPLIGELMDALADVDAEDDAAVERVLRKINKQLTTYPELWGASKVADYLGVLQPNVHKIKDLPAAAYPDLPRGQMWDADFVRKYHKDKTKRKSAKRKVKS